MPDLLRLALEQLETLPPSIWLRRSGTLYLMVNAAHIGSIGLLIGSIVPLDLRLLGLIRPTRQGWALVLGMAATAYLLLPLVNALTTSTHLGISLPAMDWSWAGMDLSFAAMGLMLAALTRHLLQRKSQPAARHALPAKAATAPGRKPGSQGIPGDNTAQEA